MESCSDDVIPQKMVMVFDLVQAAEYYIKWRGKLKAFIETNSYESSIGPIISHENNACLSSWLQSVGREHFGPQTIYTRLAIEHHQFHHLVQTIIKKVKNGNKVDAENLLKNELSQSTRRMLFTISELNEVVPKASP